MTFKITKLLAWLLLAFILFVTVSPIELRPHTIETPDIDRAAAYLATGLAFALAYPRQWKTVAVLLIFGAVAIEYLQYLSPTRHARLHDAGVKAAGAALGLAAGWAFNKWREAKTGRMPPRNFQTLTTDGDARARATASPRRRAAPPFSIVGEHSS